MSDSLQSQSLTSSSVNGSPNEKLAGDLVENKMQICEICKVQRGDTYSNTIEQKETYQILAFQTSVRTRYYVRQVYVEAVLCQSCIAAFRRNRVRKIIVFSSITLIILLASFAIWIAQGTNTNLVNWGLTIGGFFVLLNIIFALVNSLTTDSIETQGYVSEQMESRCKKKLCEQCGDAATMIVVLKPREEDINQKELDRYPNNAAAYLYQRAIGYRCARHKAPVPSPCYLRPLDSSSFVKHIMIESLIRIFKGLPAEELS